MTKKTFLKIFFLLAAVFIFSPAAAEAQPAETSATNTVGSAESTIRINLATRWLVMIEDGRLAGKYRIAGTGDPRKSPTPKGEYEIIQKEKMHRSSISGLLMPWSMRFWKGYYLHEVPEDDAGEKTTSKYSLGCIRIPEGTAEEIYRATATGTDLAIYKSNVVKGGTSKDYWRLYKTGYKKRIYAPSLLVGAEKEKLKTIPKAELAAYKNYADSFQNQKGRYQKKVHFEEWLTFNSFKHQLQKILTQTFTFWRKINYIS